MKSNLNIPHSIESQGDLSLQRTQYIHSNFVEQTRQTYMKPLNQVATMNSDQTHESIKENCEDFAVGVMKHSCEQVGDSLQLIATVT